MSAHMYISAKRSAREKETQLSFPLRLHDDAGWQTVSNLPCLFACLSLRVRLQFSNVANNVATGNLSGQNTARGEEIDFPMRLRLPLITRATNTAQILRKEMQSCRVIRIALYTQLSHYQTIAIKSTRSIADCEVTYGFLLIERRCWASSLYFTLLMVLNSLVYELRMVLSWWCRYMLVKCL